MRVYLPVLVSVLLGAVVGGVLFLVPATRQSARLSGAAPPQVTPQPSAATRAPAAAIPTRPAVNPPPVVAAPPRISPTPAPEPPPVSGPPDGEGGDAASDALVTARALAAAGRLREAQDEYVQALLLAPDDEAAWRELVAVRRRLAGGDAALLRRQAAAYRRAIARGQETEEHYTVPAMRILAQASVQAAQEIEGGAPPSPGGFGPSPIVLQATPGRRPTVTPTPAAPTAAVSSPRPRATRRPTPRATARAVPSAPAGTPKAPAAVQTTPPSPGPPLDANEPFQIVRVGPIDTASRAAEVAADLTIAGYAARVSRSEGSSTYVVTLGPYRRSVTETIVRFLRSRFPGLAISVQPAP
ncbi:MAG: SPOR domain-containing protein [bacterium]